MGWTSHTRCLKNNKGTQKTIGRMKVELVGKTAFLILFTSFVSLQLVNATGKRSYGEACSIGGHFTSIFSGEREERTCASDQGLVCTGKCSCPIGRVWESSAHVFGKPASGNDPGCFRAAGAPCFSGSSSSQNCVYNGHCEFGFCICDPGFKARRGRCIKTSANDSEGDSDEDSGNKGSPSSRFPSLAAIFNNINNYFQNGRPDSPNTENRFPSSRPSANDFDLSGGFPITRPAHDEFNTAVQFPIARPQPEDYETNYPITRPFQDDDNFYHTRPLHEELQRPYSDGKVLFPDD